MSLSDVAAPVRTVDRSSLGVGLVTLSAVAWSATGFFTRLVPVDAATTLVWRGLFGALIGLLFIAWRERRNTLRAMLEIGRGGVLFCLLSTFGMIAFIASLKFTSVAHVAIIFATIPFVAACMAWVVMRERVSRPTLVASALALAGVAVTVSETSFGGHLTGDLLAVLMTVLMAGMIVTGRMGRTPAMVPAACWSALLSALICLPFASPFALTPLQFSELGVFGCSSMGLGLIAFVVGSKHLPAAKTALIGALDTPLAPLWVWLAFGEAPSATALLGGGLVLAAVLGAIVADSSVATNG